jgi:hypothetical protein
MRRFLTLLFLMAPSAFGYASYLGWCEQGGVRVTVAGQQSPQYVNQSYPNFSQSGAGPSVTVYATGTTNKLTLFSDNSGTSLGNPFPCSATGQYQFWTANANVDLLFSGTGIKSFTIPAIPLIDPLVGPSVDIRYFGAKCDGSSYDDGPAFAAAQAAMPASGGGTILVPPNCLMKTGFTISKPLTLSAGAAGNPPSQLIGGTNGMTMFTVSGVSGVNFNNLAMSPGSGVTGVTAIALGNSFLTTINGVDFVGAFTDAVTISNSYFTMISNNRFRLNLESVSGFNNPNSTTLLNNSFFMGVAGHDSAVTIHNGTEANLIDNTFECGSLVGFYNWYSVRIDGNYFESQVGTPCDDLSATAYIGLGAPYSASPVFGAHISGNTFNGNGGYGIQIGDVAGAEISGNYFGGGAGAVLQNSSGSFQTSISGCTNAFPIVCTSATLLPFYSLPHSVGLSGFTGGWTGANGTFAGTQLTTTTFSIPLDGTGFGAVSGTPLVSVYPANSFHLGANNYGSLAEVNYIQFTGNDPASTANGTSAFQIQPTQFSNAIVAPNNVQVLPGRAIEWFGDLIAAGPTDLGSMLQMLTNRSGTFDNEYRVRSLNAIVESPFSVSKIQVPLITPFNNSVTKSAAAIFRNTYDTYIGTDNSTGTDLVYTYTSAITASSNASAAVLTTTTAPATSVYVGIGGYTGSWAAANGIWLATNLSGTTFSIPVNSTGFGAQSGSPTVTYGGVPYATVVVSNDNLPVILGVGRKIVMQVNSGAGSASKVVCWKSDGVSIGYATVAEITAGTCH